MKLELMPKDKRKTAILGAIALLCIGGIVYFLWFYGQSAVAIPSSDLSSATKETGESQILPHGADLDTKIFDEEQYKALRPAPKLEVPAEDLGKTNPFSR